ncbi:necrosis inducing protein-domain-containing protein [Xylariales sp. PMI_506]|nr:necrosis inducing protein-domain-containing protein [Xylariales sp. PMI_506]
MSTIARFSTVALLASAALAIPSRPTSTKFAFMERANTLSAPMAKRSDISVDDVVGFATTYPNNTEGELMEKWWPYLYVVDGCVPFPAVDAEGDTSGGLAPTGATDGGCSSSTGQVYARAGTYDDYFAIMYSWYMPKDEPNELEGDLGIAGHRYDWENAVVVLSAEDIDAMLVGIAASYHGDYVTCTGSGCDDYLSGSNPLIEYYSVADILDHSLGFTTTVGGMQPLIAWENLTVAAQEALTDKDWGSAIVPFLDSDFDSYLEEAIVTYLGL